MSEAAPKIVCFDWGGVLLRICRGFEQGVRAAGLAWRGELAGGEMYDVRRGLARAYQVGEIDERVFFDGVSAATGGVYSPAEVAAIHDAWLLAEYAGVGALMDELNGLGAVETAILSNTNARHWARRERDFPTCGRARHGHASHLLRLAKPDAAIYAAFEGAVGARPSEIVFFDDLAENIAAARAAGWDGVHIDHTGDTAAQMRAALAARGVLA